MSMSSRRSSRQPRCILLLLKLLFLAALVELLRCLPLHAVSASQGLQCRIPDGLFDLLFMHVKLPVFRDFDNFGLNSVHCHLQFCQVRLLRTFWGSLVPIEPVVIHCSFGSSNGESQT